MAPIPLSGFAFPVASLARGQRTSRAAVTAWHRHVPGVAGGRFHAVKDREDNGQAGERRNPHYLLLRRGQYKVATAVPGLPQHLR